MVVQIGRQLPPEAGEVGSVHGDPHGDGQVLMGIELEIAADLMQARDGVLDAHHLGQQEVAAPDVSFLQHAAAGVDVGRVGQRRHHVDRRRDARRQEEAAQHGPPLFHGMPLLEGLRAVGRRLGHGRQRRLALQLGALGLIQAQVRREGHEEVQEVSHLGGAAEELVGVPDLIIVNIIADFRKRKKKKKRKRKKEEKKKKKKKKKQKKGNKKNEGGREKGIQDFKPQKT